MKKTLLLFSILIFTITQMLTAQENCSKWSFGADYRHLIPLENLNADRYSNNNGVTFDAFYYGNQKCKVAFVPGFRISGGISDAEEDSYNAVGDLAFVSRIIMRPHRNFKPYIEAFAGVRISTAQEISTDLVDGIQETNQRFSKASSLVGLGLGTLIKITDHVDLNLKSTYDYSPRMDHYNPDNFGSSQRISTKNASDIGISIGILISIGCEMNDNNYSRERKRTRVYKPRRRLKSPRMTKQAKTVKT